MTRTPVAAGPPPPVDAAFLRAVDVLEGVVAQVPAAAWDHASPCVGWTVRDVALPDDLLAHVERTAGSVPDEVPRRPDLFGPARPVADDTSRLMAWLGRDVGSEA